MAAQAAQKAEGTKAEYYQLSQYVCQYDAVQRSVTCSPYVRTFLKAANGTMTEVSTSVNRGGRFPQAKELREEAVTEPLIVPIGSARPPPKS
ncbi:hypothetical protein JCM10213_006488 [Rhodosporidiobolus nylandii]